MLCIKKIVCIAIMALSILPSPVYASGVNSNNDDEIKLFAMVAAGAICIGGGIYLFCKAFCSESDEQVLQKAQQKIPVYRATYSDMIGLCKAHTNAPHSDYEDFLYTLAVKKHHQAGIYSYLSDLNSAIQELEKVRTELSKRIPNQSTYTLKKDMQTTVSDIQTLLNDLIALRDILATHKSYFELYQTESVIGERYARERIVLAHAYGDRNAEMFAIRHYVIAESSASGSPFPRVSYIKPLDRDIASFEERIRHTGHYPRRVQLAQQLLQSLRAIKGYIVTDATYAQEIISYEQDQREKERIRIEQEKADAERRKAAAAEEQARAERERARAEQRKADAAEDRVRSERERTRLERERLRAEHSRPQSNTTIILTPASTK